MHDRDDLETAVNEACEAARKSGKAGDASLADATALLAALLPEGMGENELLKKRGRWVGEVEPCWYAVQIWRNIHILLNLHFPIPGHIYTPHGHEIGGFLVPCDNIYGKTVHLCASS